MIAPMAMFITSKGYKTNSKEKRSMEHIPAETKHKLPKVLSQWNQSRMCLNPLAMSYDNTCEMLSIGEAHQRLNADDVGTP